MWLCITDLLIVEYNRRCATYPDLSEQLCQRPICLVQDAEREDLSITSLKKLAKADAKLLSRDDIIDTMKQTAGETHFPEKKCQAELRKDARG